MTRTPFISPLLPDSEQYYRQLFETNPHPMWVYDLETLAFLAVNDAAIRHYGYSRDEFLSMTIKDIRPEEDIPALLEIVARTSGGLDESGIWRHRKKDGGVIEVQITSHALTLDKRRAKLVLAHDVTEQRRAERELRASEKRYAALLRASPVGVFETDAEGNCLYCNETWYEIAGLGHGEALGKGWIKAIHPDDQKRIFNEWYDAVAQHGLFRCEYRFLRPDGLTTWVLGQASPLLDAAGAVSGYVGTLTDITRRKHDECKIQRLTDIHAVLSETNQAIVRMSDRDALFREICRIAVDHAKLNLAWIGLADTTSKLVNPVASYGPAQHYPYRIRITLNPDEPEGRGPTAVAIREGKHFICSDFNEADCLKPWADLWRDYGFHSSAAFPIRQNGEPIGAFCLHASEPEFFDEELTSVLDEMAVDISFALDNLEREAARKAAETKFRTLVEQIPAVTYLSGLDKQKRALYVSPQIETLLGYSTQEWLNDEELWLNLLHPDDRDRVLASVSLTIQSESPFSDDYRLQTKDGRWLWFHDEARVVETTDHGKVLQGVMLDITAEKQAMDEIERVHSRMEHILKLTPAIIFALKPELNAQGSFYPDFVSDNIEAQFGYTPEECLATRDWWISRLHPDDRTAVIESQPLLFQNDKLEHEYRFRDKDGRYHWVRDTLILLRNADGKPTEIQGSWLDITERKRLEGREAGLGRILEDSLNEVYVFDAESLRFIEVNRGARRNLGYSMEGLHGLNLFDITPELSLEAFHQMVEPLRTGEKTQLQFETVHRRHDGSTYPVEVHLQLLTFQSTPAFVAIALDIDERKAAAEHIHFLAHFDPLTRLPNRILLQDRLEMAIASAERQHHQVGLLFLDLDRFKNVNDSLGHTIGDRLLQAVAKRLETCLREEDTLARVGGDEFILILPNIKNEANAANVAQKANTSMIDPFVVGEHEFHISASIGISIYPNDGKDYVSLIKNADVAMYHAKELGRNNYQFFAEKMNTKAIKRLDMENHLRRALDRKEFELFYQPQWDIGSGRIIGGEALIRWRHPEMGMVLPAKFIPLAEETGLIVPIGEWVALTACRQNQKWQQAGLTSIPVAINISAIQFHKAGFQKAIIGALEKTGLRPLYLELELTESNLMRDAEHTLAMMAELKAAGLRLSVDDFGTGFCSLSYLKRFPIDKLKIDRSFINDITQNPDDSAIVRAIIAMAQNLQLKVIAEGVETQEQREFLKTQGCAEAQGNYFSPPLPAEEFERLLREAKPTP